MRSSSISKRVLGELFDPARTGVRPVDAITQRKEVPRVVRTSRRQGADICDWRTIGKAALRRVHENWNWPTSITGGRRQYADPDPCHDCVPVSLARTQVPELSLCGIHFTSLQRYDGCASWRRRRVSPSWLNDAGLLVVRRTHRRIRSGLNFVRGVSLPVVTFIHRQRQLARRMTQKTPDSRSIQQRRRLKRASASISPCGQAMPC